MGLVLFLAQVVAYSLEGGEAIESHFDGPVRTQCDEARRGLRNTKRASLGSASRD